MQILEILKTNSIQQYYKAANTNEGIWCISQVLLKNNNDFGVIIV